MSFIDYARKITVKLEEVKILVIGKISCRDSCPQSTSSLEEAVPTELTSYYRNTGGNGMIHSCVGVGACPSCNG